MNSKIEHKRVLVVVKTYPHPSDSYQELVCTAGMLEDGTFIRLYPIDYRYRPPHQCFLKYQWIELDVEKNTKDFRPESYRPLLETIELKGEAISTKNNWRERKAVVLTNPPQTMCGLRSAYEKDRTSLGIIKPHRITGLNVSVGDPEWKESHQSALAQYSLFDPDKKPLTKLPYDFSFDFNCGDGCRGHSMTITDWELGILYLKEVERLGSPEKAIESVRHKFFDELCGPDKDTHFFVGTVLPYNAWLILGVFYPKVDGGNKQSASPAQTSLEL
jgi:hypothetical protein